VSWLLNRVKEQDNEKSRLSPKLESGLDQVWIRLEPIQSCDLATITVSKIKTVTITI
jgi:hypothetical protein